MDERMEKALKAFFDLLTDEQKEKAKECKTAEELMEFAEKEGIELPDELLNSIAGGRVSDDLKELALSRGFLTSPGFES